MRTRSSILIFSILAAILSLSVGGFSQTVKRIIRADRHDVEEPVLEIVAVKIGDKRIRANEIVSADENWLKNIRVTVKNVGDRGISCLIVPFGLMDGIDDKMKPGESWGDVMALSYGDCRTQTSGRKIALRKNAEIEFGFESMDSRTRAYLKKIPLGKFRKAVLRMATVIYEDGEEDDVDWVLPTDTTYLDDKPY